MAKIKVDVEFKLRVGNAGRIVLPKAFRKAYELNEGDYVKIKILEIEKEENSEK